MTVFVEQEGTRELKFIGDFDKLYREDEDPWEQSGRANHPMTDYYNFSRGNICRALIDKVSEWGPFRFPGQGRGVGPRALEVGCGHGGALSYFQHNLPWLDWEGADISAVAIEQAKRMPYYIKGTPLHVWDVSDGSAYVSPTPLYKVVVLNQMFWYILSRFDSAMSNCYTLLQEGGLLVISHAFLRGEQRYGKEIADGFPGALDLLSRYKDKFRIIHAQYDDTGKYVHNDGLIILRCP